MAPHWMKVDGKIGCVFSSWGGGTELACQSLLTVLMNFGFLDLSRGLALFLGELWVLHDGSCLPPKTSQPFLLS